jgi:hypothetical protein
VVPAIEVIEIAAGQRKNQQVGETIEIHAASLSTLQLYLNHVSTTVEFKPRFEARG